MRKQQHFTLNRPLQPAAAGPDISPSVLSTKKETQGKMPYIIQRDHRRPTRLKENPSIIHSLTHSSITSPSPTIRGPVSSGGFLRVSSAASASANCRLSFSSAFRKGKMKLFKHYINLMNGMDNANTQTENKSQRYFSPTYWSRTFRVKENNPQNLLNCDLIPLLIKLCRRVI